MQRLMKFAFHLLYHSFAWSYDGVAALVSLGRWADWRRAALPHVIGPRVLEIGYGTGHLQADLLGLGCQAFGLDESRQMAALARQTLLDRGLQPSLVRGLAQAMPFAAERLDCVLATFPSEFISDAHSLSEIYRLLKPAGRLVVIPMAWFGGSSLPEKAAQALFQITGQTAKFEDGLESRLRHLFSASGFHVEVMRETVRASLVLIVIAEK